MDQIKYESILQYLHEKMREADHHGKETSNKGYPSNLICVNGATHYNVYCEIDLDILQPILKHESLPKDVAQKILEGKTSDETKSIVNTASLQKLINFIEKSMK